MIDLLDKFIGVFNKLAPPTALAMCLASGFILFSSDEFVSSLGIERIRDENKGLIGWLFIISISVLVSAIIYSFKDFLFNVIRKYRLNRKRTKHLHELTLEEIQLIKRFMDGENTIKCSDVDGISSGGSFN